MNYRNLSQQEISLLQTAGCEAEDWRKVYTSMEDSSGLAWIRDVLFSGEVRFGRFDRWFELPGGLL